MADATSPSGRKGSASPPNTGRSHTSGSTGATWIPPGIRPQSAIRRPVAQSLTGSRRNKAVEHSHVWPDSVGEAGAEAPAANNHYWLYGAYDYKIHTTIEQARQFVCRLVDKLVEKMTRMHLELAMLREASSATAEYGSQSGGLHRTSSSSKPTLLTRRQPTGTASGGPDASSRANALGGLPKGHLIFDLIATKKHVGTGPEDGLPFQLGRDIYAYVEEKYNNDMSTVFVGLTDNTARRVGRDIFYTKSDELSKTRIPFAAIDREHLFVIFPLQGGKKAVEPSATSMGCSMLGGSQQHASGEKAAKTSHKGEVKFHN